MTRPNRVATPQSLSGRQDRGAAWARPLRRAHRAIDASVRLIGSTLRAREEAERCAHRRPLRTSHNLDEASGRLLHASRRLQRAVEQLAATNQCIALAPEEAASAPELLIRATERWMVITVWLQHAADDVFSLHRDVLRGLETGRLVPERPDQPGPRRARIHLAPRPVPIRAFLVLRQPRVVDRITPMLRRRRRTPRPAAIRVPHRSLLGRAPPLSAISLL